MASDDLDDLFDSALDDLEDDTATGGPSLEEAAAASAAVMEEGSRKEAEAAAATSSAASPADPYGGLGQLIKALEDPEMASTLEETLRKLGSGEGAEGLLSELGASEVRPAGSSHDVETDSSLAATLQMLAEATKSMEGMDASAGEQAGEEIMRKMMGEFEKMGEKGDFSSTMDGMMEQLLSKDVMYLPLKQICEQYPAWLASNEERLSKEEYENYGMQFQYYQQIVHIYELEPDNFPKIMALFEDMQETGQPPMDMMKTLAPGLEFGADGLPKMPGMEGFPGGATMPGAGCTVM
eukprot:PLAT3031.1.p1 GENE.PLAT3031.1~~PLAT3031.1.p1  ORF type:complete len:309 (+),score=119.32 PLAT3031.1:44-928(+)